MSIPNKQGPRRPDDPRTRIRRSDRAIEDAADIKRMLHRTRVGFIATSLEGQPYLNPNLFWYDEDQHRIYFHTALTGRTRSNIEANPNVCFAVAAMGDLLPAETALEFSTEYASVIIFGHASVVSNEQQAKHGLNGLLTKYFPDLKPDQDYRGITSDELDRTSVFAIDIESWSGKEKARS